MFTAYSGDRACGEGIYLVSKSILCNKTYLVFGLITG